MFCLQCGKQIENTAKFCPYCGAVVASNQPESSPAADETGSVQTPSSANASAPASPRRRRGIVIALVAALVVVALAGILVVSGVFGGAKGKVARAFAKTASAYADMIQAAGIPDLRELTAGKKFSQSAAFELTDINSDYFGFYYDLSALEGLGIRYTSDTDMPGRRIAVSVTPFYGSAELLTVQMAVDDANVYIGSPELTEDAFYGLNTETLGSDLDDLGADMDELSDLSFNIFDVAEKFEKLSQLDDESKKTIQEAVKELAAAIEVEKIGPETIDVNDYSVNCTAYSVLIPQDAMERCMDQIEDVVRNVDYTDAYEELMASFGLPDELLDEIMDELDGADLDYSKEVFDAIEDLLDEMGDVELQVYLRGGYVMAVTYADKLNGTKLEIGTYFGGGKTYVNDLSIVVSLDNGDAEIVLTSNGNHEAKDGTFTDDTVLKISESGYTVKISSEYSYAAKEKENNFSWCIVADGVTVNMEGQLTAGKNALSMQLDEVELRAYGSKLLEARLDYEIGSYQEHFTVKSPVMLADMMEDSLLDIVSEIEDNAYDWANDLLEEIPGLEYLI